MRLMLAEDSALLREGLARTLAARGIEVTGQAADTASLLRLVDHEPPDVVLLDLRMPPTFTDEGLQAAEHIRTAHPDVALLVLSQYADIALAARLVDALPHAAGYLLKERIGDTAQLTDALHRVTRGELVLDPDLVRALVTRRRAADPLQRLSDRERAVLTLMAEGRSNAGIAGRLYLAPKASSATSPRSSTSSACRLTATTTGGSWPSSLSSGPRLDPWCGGPPTSEQMAQQVDITLGPRLLPECLDHHGTRICLPGQSQGDVVVDPHPGAAVRDPRPPVPGIQPVIVSKQDDKGHPAGTGQLGHFGEQRARQAPGPLAFRDAQVDDPERPQHGAAHPDDPELHTHLGRNSPAAGHRDIPEMGRQLEVAPARIPRKARLQ